MSELRDWLSPFLEDPYLSEDSEGYLLSRAATHAQIRTWRCFTWECPDAECPDAEFRKSFGPKGERLQGRLIIPPFSPRGMLLGWDSRSTGAKHVGRYRVGDRPWDPAFLGIQDALEKLWRGADLYVVEGSFDVYALARVREKDAVLGSGPAHLSFRQLEFIRRSARGKVWMVYDNDDAGRKGTAKALDDLRRRRVSAESLRYGAEGDDPGKIWTDYGMSGLTRAFT